MSDLSALRALAGLMDELAQSRKDNAVLSGQVARVEAAMGNHPKTCESVQMEKACGWKRAYADVEQALAIPTGPKAGE